MIPRELARRLFPELANGVANPSKDFAFALESHGVSFPAARVVHWNQGTRNEYFLTRYRPSARVDEVTHTASVRHASHLRARRLGLVALVARRLGVPVRGIAATTDPTLVEDGFADRWSFPQARIGWTGVYAGEDNE